MKITNEILEIVEHDVLAMETLRTLKEREKRKEVPPGTFLACREAVIQDCLARHRKDIQLKYIERKQEKISFNQNFNRIPL